MKYFAISDIHSCYTAMKKSLDEAGYNIANPEHFLIVCGDIFDRGQESKEVLTFLKNIPKERRAFIRGNHEYLLKDALWEMNNSGKLGDLGGHHYSNGTVQTICHFLGFEYTGRYWTDIYELKRQEQKTNIIKEIVDWTMSDDWIDYYEVDDLIFVHCWIPVIDNDNLPMYYIQNRHFEYDPDWRSRAAHGYDWEEASWGCPWVYHENHLVPPGKTIVCGHWHTSSLHEHYNNQVQDNNEIFYKKDLIGLDACTPVSGFCNVLVIDEQGKIFDRKGKELKEN